MRHWSSLDDTDPISPLIEFKRGSDPEDAGANNHDLSLAYHRWSSQPAHPIITSCCATIDWLTAPGADLAPLGWQAALPAFPLWSQRRIGFPGKGEYREV